ncbi:nucleotidyltransferase domain-containing protein [Kineosporia sp. NBRC 101731]|uniref:nucleotidyltransferase domain-containing protein n=1 Tax=Kineosporia sp. NBRC 101731 TaxID=3032199 RepID=UPI0024A28A35|nr:nucleotidyltransferase domain-containing protein [Kineosporia sp. NBRC 101731]GLY32116.1 nucleotidyltransferase [Kineosporia sp. NBRC 101731]
MTALILSGVVGSTAYGLAREGSDIDRMGVFVAPTLDVAGLDWHPHRESRASHDPDVAMHEIGKTLRLMLKCNPTLLEMLHLDDYEVLTDEGRRLVDARSAFLSEKYVRDSYGGYAKSQAHRLATEERGYFSSNTKNRTAKHGRHLLRLLRQGRELLSTGSLTVRVSDPEEYWAFDLMSPAQMLDVYAHENELFEATSSVLPTAADRDRVSALLDSIRAAHLERTTVHA